jgi:hypothetical protein
MEQLGSHWTDVHERSYLSKTARNIQASLKSDKKSVHFSGRPPTFLIISLSVFLE